MAQLAGPAGSREPGLPGPALDSALPEGRRPYQAALRAPPRQQTTKGHSRAGPGASLGGLSPDVCAAGTWPALGPLTQTPGRTCLRCRKGKLRLGADEDALRHTPLRDAGKRLPGRRHPAFRDRGCDGPTPPGGPQAPASGRPSEETVRAGVGEGAGISGGAERQSQREPQRWCEGRPGRRSRCGDTPAGASGRPPGRGQPRLVAASTQTAAGGRRASPASIPPSAEGRRVPFSFLRERPSF